MMHNWISETVRNCEAMIDKHLHGQPAPLARVGLTAEQVRQFLPPPPKLDSNNRLGDDFILDVLKTIRCSGVIMCADVARALGTSSYKVGQAVAELVKMNYPIRRRMTGGCREYIFRASAKHEDGIDQWMPLK